MSDDNNTAAGDARPSWIERLCERAQMLFIEHPGEIRRIRHLLENNRHSGLSGADMLLMMEGLVHVADMHVKDIMVPRSQMVVVSHEMGLDDVLGIAIESGHSRFPVIGDGPDDVRGVLLAKDLLRSLRSGRDAEPGLEDYIRQQAVVPQSKRLNVLLDEFRKNRNHMAIVVDEYGGTAGLVTIEDVLEQIVGDISDEHDVTEDQYIYDHGGGRYAVKALTPLAFFNQYFQAGLESRGVDTVGGMVIEALGHMPKRGDEVSIGPFLFEVVHADSRRVHLLAVEKQAA